MRKKGMTLVMLSIYISVLLVLFGITVSTVLNNTKAQEITEDTYKAIIIEYVNEFNTTKDYYRIKSKEIPNGIIEGSELLEYIPSISLEHVEYILIQDGQIKYNKEVVSQYAEKEYLEDLASEGIIEEYTP
ncbi:MAG: hypothetical protein E7311_05635 [Clostridiales bacterium]|nr:hypothetical protein [Clostridiales bacterium]